ncbi:MAG: hypothetical protein QOF04_100 [Solirubrobacteraceae bacterium]|jgi:hypothetical protein|nr:hypothetical protein [Solirubrobacteraceae bacterium]
MTEPPPAEGRPAGADADEARALESYRRMLAAASAMLDAAPADDVPPATAPERRW